VTGTGYELAVVGTSWGGVEALSVILKRLREDLALAIAIVQHRSRDAPEAALMSYLQARCPLPVVEVEDKVPIQKGHVHVAPADYHLLVDRDGFALSVDDLVHYSRPSIDVLFESAADVYAERLIGVVLTGANADGAAGVTRIKKLGGYVIVQEPDTADRPEMPAAAVATGMVDEVLSLEGVADVLNRLGAP
jgi:two-component system, chemotaxis family, protein-glutamate methylesterase/glutaminase